LFILVVKERDNIPQSKSSDSESTTDESSKGNVTAGVTYISMHTKSYKHLILLNLVILF